MLLAAAALGAVSCGGLKVRLGTPSEEPLKEFTVEGTEKGKVLVIPVTGFLSDAPGKGLLERRPSVVQEVVSQLRRAEKDREVRAVVLEINSPGGSITASDILYRELMDFKERTGAAVVAALMDVAASGAYYLALSADRIVAHPTTVTGSVGVILVKPKVMGLMEKLGLAVEVDKSGRDKDIGSPFRPSTAEEQEIFRDLVDKLGGRFIALVAIHRKIAPEDLQKIFQRPHLSGPGGPAPEAHRRHRVPEGRRGRGKASRHTPQGGQGRGLSTHHLSERQPLQHLRRVISRSGPIPDRPQPAGDHAPPYPRLLLPLAAGHRGQLKARQPDRGRGGVPRGQALYRQEILHEGRQELGELRDESQP